MEIPKAKQKSINIDYDEERESIDDNSSSSSGPSSTEPSPPPVDVDSQRVITTGALVFIAYFSTCGGPFGVETGVGAGGPWALLILALLPIFWALPQALWTAELAALTGQNGGTIVWIQRAWGDLIGFQNAYNNLLSNIFMVSIWPVMILNYITNWITNEWPNVLGFEGWQIWLTKILLVMLVTILNVRGLQVIGAMSILLFIAIIFPFVAMFIIVASRGDLQPSAWFDFPPVDEVRWSECLSTLLWCFTGWDLLGTFAGEVKDVKTSYPRGIILALIISFLNYSIPVITGLSVVPGWRDWGTGDADSDGTVDFNEIALLVAPWLSKAMFIASFLNGFGQYNAILSTVSRALWAMGKRPINSRGEEEGELKIPAIFGLTWERYNTPWVAIVSLSLLTVALSALKFEYLVTLAMFLNCITIKLEYASFVRLRFTEPNSPRPFKIGGGNLGLILMGSPLIFTTGLLITADWEIWVAALGVHGLIMAAYFIKTEILKKVRARDAYLEVPRTSASTDQLLFDGSATKEPPY